MTPADLRRLESKIDRAANRAKSADEKAECAVFLLLLLFGVIVLVGIFDK